MRFMLPLLLLPGCFFGEPPFLAPGETQQEATVSGPPVNFLVDQLGQQAEVNLTVEPQLTVDFRVTNVGGQSRSFTLAEPMIFRLATVPVGETYALNNPNYVLLGNFEIPRDSAIPGSSLQFSFDQGTPIVLPPGGISFPVPAIRYPRRSEHDLYLEIVALDENENEIANNLFLFNTPVSITRDVPVRRLRISTKSADPYYNDTFCMLFDEEFAPRYGSGVDALASNLANQPIHSFFALATWMPLVNNPEVIGPINHWQSDNLWLWVDDIWREDDQGGSYGSSAVGRSGGIDAFVPSGRYYLRCQPSPLGSTDGNPKGLALTPISYCIQASVDRRPYETMACAEEESEYSQNDMLNTDGTGARRLNLDGPILDGLFLTWDSFHWYVLDL